MPQVVINYRYGRVKNVNQDKLHRARNIRNNYLINLTFLYFQKEHTYSEQTHPYLI